MPELDAARDRVHGFRQSVEQVFGLRMDGTQKTLVIKPQGLLSGYNIQKTHLGAYVFDIEYREEKGKLLLILKTIMRKQ